MIPPRELEEIRFRMIEELDLPNRQRCEMLEEELEKQRESFFEMRRQLEKMKFDNFQVFLPSPECFCCMLVEFAIDTATLRSNKRSMKPRCKSRQTDTGQWRPS